MGPDGEHTWLVGVVGGGGARGGSFGHGLWRGQVAYVRVLALDLLFLSVEARAEVVVVLVRVVGGHVEHAVWIDVVGNAGGARGRS